MLPVLPEGSVLVSAESLWASNCKWWTTWTQFLLQDPKNDLPVPQKWPVDLHQVLLVFHDGVQVLRCCFTVAKQVAQRCETGPCRPLEPGQKMCDQWIYHLVMTFIVCHGKSPCLRTVNHLFLWAIFHGELLVCLPCCLPLWKMMKNDEKWWKKRRCTHRMVHSWDSKIASSLTLSANCTSQTWVPTGWVFKGLG